MTEARNERDNFSRDLRARRLYLYPKLPYYWITPADVNVSYAGLRRPVFLFREYPSSTHPLGVPKTRTPRDLISLILLEINILRHINVCNSCVGNRKFPKEPTTRLLV